MEDTLASLRENEKKILLDILKALRSIRYGHVQITVHDSTVVQIDKTEKIRFGKSWSERHEDTERA
jgi:hypothetical protein